MTLPPTTIVHPLRDLNAWVARFRAAEIPVLAETADTIQALAANEDAVDARLLAEHIGGDPLMSLRLLAHVAARSRRVTDVESITGALVLLGISPFFRHFAELQTVESQLEGHGEALAGLRAVVRRAHRGAMFALGFAVHRMDPDAGAIHQAALLHDFAELLLWCHAPTLALEISRRQAADPTLRSVQAQKAVIGIDLVDLQQALMKAWHLPELLIRLGDDHHADNAAVRNVLLAIRLARHTADGWDNAALPDDLHDIGQLLRLGPAATQQLVRELDT